MKQRCRFLPGLVVVFGGVLTNLVVKRDIYKTKATSANGIPMKGLITNMKNLQFQAQERHVVGT